MALVSLVFRGSSSFCLLFQSRLSTPPPLQSPLLHYGLSLHSPMGLFLPCTPAVHDGSDTGLSRWTDHLAMGASWYLSGRDHGAFSPIRLPSVGVCIGAGTLLVTYLVILPMGPFGL
ncbi:hypothetical protein C0J52_24501 [Blattella germanica]|nr:hypothetical protein C0J52_24501 [Blattella germanica]